MMQNSPVKLIGLYSVDENPDVTLVELIVNKKADEFDIDEFTQEIEDQPRLNWQAPFAEKYLSLDGETIIGDDIDLPEYPTATTRLTFFFYFLDPSKPLMTPFGKLHLIEKQEQPKRIKGLIKLENHE
jgi:hypothetical protein